MRLIDADALKEAMYHEAFEKDTDMQKWDGGCWIRYKMFENKIKEAPTIEERKTDWIPVTERLPEWGEDVLVTSGTTVLFAWRSNVDGMWQCAGIDDGLVVTAWMPLPKRYGGSAKE